MKRSPLKRTPMKRKPARDPITPETRAEVNARSGGWCECRKVCDSGIAHHMHHIRLRRHGDHTAANLLHVCLFCHAWIHDHPAEARERGWLI